IRVTLLTEALVAAIEAETRTYRTQAGVDAKADNEACAAAGAAVSAIEAELRALPIDANTIPAYGLALALAHRRWLVCDGSYSSADSGAQLVCRMVDAVLFGSALDGVSLLWHID